MIIFRQKVLGVDRYICDALLGVYMRQVPILLVGDVFAAIMLVYVLWDMEKHELLLYWFAFHLICSVFVLLMVNNYRKHALKHHGQKWALYQLPWVIVFGALWGVVPLQFLDSSSLFSVVMVTIFLLSVVSATLYAYSLLPPYFYMFLMLIFIPYSYMLFQSMRLIPIAMSTIGMLVLLSCISYAISQMLKKNLSAQYEKEEYAVQLEEAKREAEQAKMIAEHANQSKNRFLVSASHDLRQPLQAQRLFLASLASRLRERDNMALLNQARKAESEVGNMLDELMDIARFDYGATQIELVPVVLEPLLSSLVDEMEPIATEADLYLHMNVSPSLCVKSEPILLKRMLRNLLNNAFRYTKKGGVLLAARLRGNVVRIEVWDTGIGIAEEKINHIFREFYQAEKKNTFDAAEGIGIGLATVRRLSFTLEHSVEVCSRLGQGSCFFVSLPSCPMPSDFLAVGERCDPIDVAGLFIIVVEDDPAILEGMRVLLRGWSCEVLLAESQSALMAELALGAYPVPDALITDFNLPEESGLDVIQSVREYFQIEVPAFIVSGNMSKDIKTVINELDCCWLKKPVNIDELQKNLGAIYTTRHSAPH